MSMEASTARSYTTQVSPNAACTHDIAIATLRPISRAQTQVSLSAACTHVIAIATLRPISIAQSYTTQVSLSAACTHVKATAALPPIRTRRQDVQTRSQMLHNFRICMTAVPLHGGLPRKHVFLCHGQVLRTAWCVHHVKKVLSMPVHMWGFSPG